MLDTLIKGGTVVDGSGGASRTADVGILDGRIVEIGRISTTANRVIEADGLLVTPGFIDVHTHYDGQATWDPILDPSFSSGVTTAIMGNCGVGFAPVAPGSEERLIELMEGVEEIPGTALHAGLRWNWSRFTEYLDVLDAMPRTFDIGTLVPHGPLRLWAMGDKVGTDKCASGGDLANMIDELDTAMKAGAFGMATSRTSMHRTVTGEMTPDFHVDAPELKALAQVVARYGGILEVAPDGLIAEGVEALKGEMALYEDIIAATGVNLHLLMFESAAYPEYLPEQMALVRRMNLQGSRVTGQFSGRCSGALLSFFGGHPFMERPTMAAIEQRPIDEWLGELAKPEIKARLLAETSAPGGFGEFLSSYWHRLYDLGPGLDYEPDDSRSIAHLAAAAGTTPADYAYDLMLAHSERPRVYAAITNYTRGKLDVVSEMLAEPAIILGVSDAGAHVLSVCDGSIHSFMLTHWARDRTRGPKLSLENVVNLLTAKTARSIGLNDRGTIALGMHADLNVIDYAALALQPPRFFHDLPTGARRVMQQVNGYAATIVNGIVTRERDEATGERPGRLVRHHPQ